MSGFKFKFNHQPYRNYFYPQAKDLNHIFFTTNKNFDQFTNLHSDTIYLFNYFNFTILGLMPKTFKITTNTGSSFFNVDLLKDLSSVIKEFLKDNPNNFHYHLEIDDKDNILGKFEQLFQGNGVYFKEEDIPTYLQIVSMLNLERCPPYKKKEEADPGSQKDLAKGAVIDIETFERFLKSKELESFTISTKRNEYRCNIFGILLSKTLCELITKDPTVKRYEYDFEDQFDEFKIICDIFNFNYVDATSNNINSLKKIAEDLQITCIFKHLDNIISNFDGISDEIDHQQSIVDTIDELFDLLYNIRYKTVKTVCISILASHWSKTEENVRELAAFIIQVIKTDLLSHPYLIDLLEQLDQNSKELTNLKILLPLVIDQLMLSFSQSKSNCSFIYLLYKKGFISLRRIIKSLKNITSNEQNKFQNTIENVYSWFLPELIDAKIFNESYITNQPQPQSTQNTRKTSWNNNKGFDQKKSNNDITNFSSFIKMYYPNNIDSYKHMRDDGEPHDELTKALRHDDVDKVQSILSHNIEDCTTNTIPYNIFEDFVPNGTTRYINYAAAYGSVKCFKYLLLNNYEIDNETFRMAVFGGNTEIIQIVDKSDIDQQVPMNYNRNLYYYYNNNPKFSTIIGKIIPSIEKNQNQFFDWIIENKFTNDDKTKDNLLYLINSAISNGNAHAMISIIDCGFCLSNYSTNKSLIQIAAKNGFSRLAQIFSNLIKKNQIRGYHFNPKLNSKYNTKYTFTWGSDKNNNSTNSNYDYDYFPSPNIEDFVSFGNLEIFKLSVEFFPACNIEQAFVYSVSHDYMKIIEYFFNELNKDKKIITLEGISSALTNSVCKSNLLFDYLMDKYEKSNKLIFEKFKSYNKILSVACKHNNFEAVKKLIKLVLEINPNDEFSLSFISAASIGSNEICQYFIDQKLNLDFELLPNNSFNLGYISKEIFTKVIDRVKPSLKTNFLISSLSPAIQKKNIELVDYILSQKITNENMLFDAIIARDIEMVNLVLKYNSKPYFVNKRIQNGSALYIATVNGDVSIVKRLLEVPGINLNQHSVQILYHLCKKNKCDLLKLFLKTGLIDTNFYDLSNGNSILMDAIYANNEEVAKLLIDYDKTDLSAQNYKGETALVIAASLNSISIIDMLINNERFDPESNYLDYAFYISIENENRFLDAAKLLFKAKNLDVNYKYICDNSDNEVYYTPLMTASLYDNIDAIELIVSHPTFDKEKSNIECAIFYSIIDNKVNIFKKLVELDGRNINEIKYKKSSMFFYVISNKRTRFIVELLNNPQFKPNESDIQMIFEEINNFDYNGIDMLTFLTKLLSYCKEHKGLFDFTKVLPSGKSLFTMITKTDFPNIKDIVNLLVENGADPNKPDKFNVYPLEHAIMINYFEFFVALLNLKQINCDQKIQMSENAVTSSLGNWNATTSGSGNWNVTIPVFRDWNTASSGSENLNTDKPVFGNLNTTTTGSENLNTAASGSENLNTAASGSENLNTAASGSENLNTAASGSENLNTATIGSGNLNTAKPVFGNWNATKPVFGNWNTTKPVFGNWNTTKPVFGNWNATKPVFGNWNTTKYKNLFANPKCITYLHLAAISSNSNILMEFINRKLIDVNVTDDKGNTPLIYACQMHLKENIKILMNIDNIDFLHRNQDDQDALYATFMRKTKDEEEIKDKKIYLEKILEIIDI